MHLTTAYDVILATVYKHHNYARIITSKIQSIFGDEIFKSCHGILGKMKKTVSREVDIFANAVEQLRGLGLFVLVKPVYLGYSRSCL